MVAGLRAPGAIGMTAAAGARAHTACWSKPALALPACQQGGARLRRLQEHPACQAEVQAHMGMFSSAKALLQVRSPVEDFREQW